MKKTGTFSVPFYETITKSNAEINSAAIVFPPDGPVDLPQTWAYIEEMISEGYTFISQSTKIFPAEADIGQTNGRKGGKWFVKELKAQSMLKFSSGYRNT